MLDWFRSFMPKEDRFFDLFEQHAALVAAGAESLQAALSEGSADGMMRHLQAVSEREDEADAVAREVMLAVRRSFITPFDRVAIIALIGSLDDAIDEMKKTCKAVRVFEYTAFEPEMRAIADRIVSGSKVVQATLPLLRSIGTNGAKIGEMADRMHTIEDETDDIYDAARTRLYKAKGLGQPAEFWVASEILGHLESVADKLEDVVNQISEVAIENA
jgi:predicted phosphate transport protein (TIGR00153 family)